MERDINSEKGRGQMTGEQGKGKNVEEEERRENIEEEWEEKEIVGKSGRGGNREEKAGGKKKRINIRKGKRTYGN